MGETTRTDSELLGEALELCEGLPHHIRELRRDLQGLKNAEADLSKKSNPLLGYNAHKAAFIEDQAVSLAVACQKLAGIEPGTI